MALPFSIYIYNCYIHILVDSGLWTHGKNKLIEKNCYDQVYVEKALNIFQDKKCHIFFQKKASGYKHSYEFKLFPSSSFCFQNIIINTRM